MESGDAGKALLKAVFKMLTLDVLTILPGNTQLAS